MSKKVQTVKGMRDLLPDDLAKMEHIEALFLKTASQYGFVRVQTPTLELAEIYQSTSEFPQEKCYSLVDGKGRNLVLRSDPDAPLARLVANHYRYDPKPIKLAFCGSIFRSWNTRRREFRMFSINTFGVDEPMADAEILRVVADVVEEVGFPGYRIEFNNLQLFRSIIAAAGSKSESSDRVNDILYAIRFAPDQESVISLLDSHNLPRNIIDAVLSLLECSDESSAYDILAGLGQKFPSLIPELEKTMVLREAFQSHGLKHSHLNVTNLHGTGFYSGFTYRLFPKDNPKEIGDGGRYDHMMQQMQSESIPATGIGLGIERFIELMAASHCLMALPTQPRRIIVAYDETTLAAACRPILRQLRSSGLVVEEDLAIRGFNKTVRYAKSKKYNRVVMIKSELNEQLRLKILNLDDDHAESLIVHNQEELLGILLKC
ncbi:MAG: ATP phosphoribosyltransferase regulatory subunit [bacterium ADurb.Bin400]|nr:MAG: ATP phosphoribosyltransferase regulatory subunit [bacterium ADurb.Bin400]